MVGTELERGALWPDPLVQVSPSYADGDGLEQLVCNGDLHPRCRDIFVARAPDGRTLGPLRLRRHQTEAIHAAGRGLSYVLTSGTGSGKSLAYVIPIVDHVIRTKAAPTGRPGIKAIIVYPMNALANSQLGELQKFLRPPGDSHPVTFQRYTGQESDEERRAIISNPPDILLTNYVMLELLLQRPHEQQIIRAAQCLRFLVFDELHTYRGRQGADVALLARRVREACNAPDLQCVGTSATLAAPDSEGVSWGEQRAAIAAVASSIFGVDVTAAGVIGETLERRTPEIEESPSFFLDLARAIAAWDTPSIDSAAAFLAHPISVWVETRLGLARVPDPDGERLLRARPTSMRDAATRLADESGANPERAFEVLRKTFLDGANIFDGDGRPALAFRLHQFIARGDAVYASPEAPQTRYLTLEGQRFVPEDRSKVLLPLVFCRECGQDYYVVRREREGGKGPLRFVGRDLGECATAADSSSSGAQDDVGFIYLDPDDPWVRDRLPDPSRLPEAWLESDPASPTLTRLKRSMAGHLPRPIVVSPDGVEGKGSQRALWLDAPFTFCLRCGVTYAGNQRSDFGKLATLGSEGRSTATTITSLGLLRELRDPHQGVPAHARKLLAFTDNRQDASLQAGHFNDFVTQGLIRSGVAKALTTAGSAGLLHDQILPGIFDALALPLSAYAVNPDVEFLQREDTERAFRSIIGHIFYGDLRRGWRVTSPNLEECGLMEIEYRSLRHLAASDSHWQAGPQPLALATADQRFAVAKTLLDHLRRELAIRVEFLDPERLETIRQQADQSLTETWRLDDIRFLAKSVWAVPGSQSSDLKLPYYRDRVIFVSARAGFGQLLRRLGTLGAPIPSLVDTEPVIAELFRVLAHAGLLHREEIAPLGATYRVNASAFVFRAGDGTRAFHDPIRVPSAPADGLRANPYFRTFYRDALPELRSLEAREHTAQVGDKERRDREDRFRKGTLPVLYCSPTMELGIDIADLSVVGLRNVPPTPANYAQRSGRAGRSGQPAFILTYCSAGSSHDRWFFRHPGRMVAGAVSPPRVDLQNDELVRAHVHAIWLGVSGVSLGRSISEVLDVAGDEPTLAVIPSLREALDDVRHRNSALTRSRTALGAVVDKLTSPGESVDAWLAQVLDRLPQAFEDACERWRSLYRAALDQWKRQDRIARDASRSADERDRARMLRREAENQRDVLLQEGTDPSSDFYSYRYFASEGFLPGYNFPRLPLSAFLQVGRRGGRDEYLQRPRFLAIAEFGPQNTLYHEGSRFRVQRVLAAPEAPSASNRTSSSSATPLVGAIRCAACGYYHPLGDDPAPDVCEHCGVELPPARRNMFPMRNVVARRRDRITSDEEERQRFGYDLRTAVRFAARGGRLSVRTAEVHGDAKVATLTFGQSASLWRINYGWRNRKKDQPDGFMLDFATGKWEQADDDVQPSQPSGAERVIPFVEDRKNALVLAPAEHLETEEMASLQAALKSAIQIEFQLEDRELAAEPLPSSADRRRILFYEASEGGAGVLRRLVDEPDAWHRVIRRALELCHFDPTTGQDLGGPPGRRELCEAACYDCLLSYFNQPDHGLVDRRAIVELLVRWSRAAVQTSPSSDPRAEHRERLIRLTQSDLERRFVELVDRLGLRLPSDAQVLLDIGTAQVKPDFLYRDAGLAIFIDGPHHDAVRQQAVDRAQADGLSDIGWQVLRFPHSSDWVALLASMPSVFGALGAPPPGGLEPRAEAELPHLDLGLFDEAWHPLIERLSTAGVEVQPGGDVSGPTGRVAGFVEVIVVLGDRQLALVGENATPDGLEAALAARGQSLLVLVPGAGEALEQVLAALEPRRP